MNEETIVQLPQKTVLRIYGTGGVGKGTLGKRLSENFAIPTIDTGLAWRAVTFLFLQEGFVEWNYDIAAQLFARIELTFDKLEKVVQIDGESVDIKNLRTKEIDSNVAKLSSLSEARDLFYSKIKSVILSLHTPCIADGRAANEKYLTELESEGWVIARIHLTADIMQTAQRRFKDYLAIEGKKNPGLFNDPIAQEALFAKSLQAMVERDSKDQETWKRLGLTEDASDAFVVDTTKLTPEEVYTIVIQYLQNRFQ